MANKNKKPAKAETAKAENKNTVSVLIVKPEGYAIVEAKKTEPAPVKGENKGFEVTIQARRYGKQLYAYDHLNIAEIDFKKGVVVYSDGKEKAIDFKPYEKKPEPPFDIMKKLGFYDAIEGGIIPESIIPLTDVFKPGIIDENLRKRIDRYYKGEPKTGNWLLDINGIQGNEE